MGDKLDCHVYETGWDSRRAMLEPHSKTYQHYAGYDLDTEQ